ALGWMIGIARYRAIDLLRHERAAPVLMPELPDSAESDSGGAADETSSPPSALLERCLGELPDEAQRCLQFAYINGRSHQEISQLTGSPLGTVKSWIRRALFALRECLES
ncbi:MAG: sigma factor-like helix-turn-helix DNA-binding protein, partial [Steroidobacteraceae bacterium]